MEGFEIPRCILPDAPYTNAQYECYVNSCAVYVAAVAECIDKGKSPEAIQACIQQKHADYLAYLPVCDTM